MVEEDEEFWWGVGIEVGGEVVVGIESEIVLKERFEEVEECSVGGVGLL